MGGAEGGSGGAGGESSPGDGRPLVRADKVDLLLVVDNSISMADKQEILELSLSDLVEGMTNPPCLDPGGRAVSPRPVDGRAACPAGSRRAHPPIEDMHIGVISSSLGGHGASTCTGRLGRAEDDRGRLLARSNGSPENDLPTYAGMGFLAWDPGAKYSPPGDADAATFVQKLRDIVIGVGQTGCGYEAPLESWYRFLVDPEPHATIRVENGVAIAEGIDHELLQQRAAFLRPDSALAIVMLTDENDCSIVDGGEAYLLAEARTPAGAPFRMWRPRSECAVDPNDPCCRSCAMDPGECPPDPTCTAPDGAVSLLHEEEDPLNLRCFDQKRRFGYDALYPIERYTTALTSAWVVTRDGTVTMNPLFSPLDPNGSPQPVRAPELVSLTGIVGVPWQDVARDPNDLSAGLKTADELAAPLAGGGTTWDVILGDPERLSPPGDPLMIESVSPRSGVNPITGDPVAPPGSVENPMNGSEWTITERNDLQFACTFPLLSPKSCAAGAVCDCPYAESDSPLCAPNPDDGGNMTLQVRAKAYPGLRELSLLKRLGPQAITASICPAQVDDASRPDFGYRPIARALLERLSQQL